MAESIETVGIIGIGRMGTGIAYEALLGGFRVLLRDVSDEQVRTGLPDIVRRAEADYRVGQLPRLEYDVIVSRIEATYQTTNSRCDLIIEAVLEDEETKRSVYADLPSNLNQSTVIATNTSSISVTRLASATDHPDRFIGMHFMYPVHSIKLVELVRGIETADSSFIVNRVLLSIINEAAYVLSMWRCVSMHINEWGRSSLQTCSGWIDACHCCRRRIVVTPSNRPAHCLVKYVEAGCALVVRQSEASSSIPVSSR